jgi:hypothetical protein
MYHASGFKHEFKLENQVNLGRKPAYHQGSWVLMSKRSQSKHVTEEVKVKQIYQHIFQKKESYWGNQNNNNNNKKNNKIEVIGAYYILLLAHSILITSFIL